jgi:phage-related minor tail protein
MKKVYILVAALTLAVSANVSAADDPTVWEKTKDVASDMWDGTKEVTSDVWDGTKEVTSDVWDGTKQVGSDIKNGLSDEKEVKTEPQKTSCAATK